MLVIASATFAFAACASLWVAPRALGSGAPEAYATFHDGSRFGIVLFTVAWTLWSAACVTLVLVNLTRSDAWARGGRHRSISLAGSALMTYGLIGTASWMPYLQVDLAMEHVIPWQQRESGASALFHVVWVTSACAMIAALALGAAGAAIDRAIGKAPLLTA
ncbi:hypothetical protein ASE14_19325 [Agromyces sp. Root81]|nr:hypothetical protein ASE14_19325 [Agromyces sp. Root81]